MGFVVAIAAFAAFVVFLIWLIRRQRRMANEAWAEAAARTDGTFEPKHGPWYKRRRLLRARPEGVVVDVDHYAQSTGSSTVVYTRARADVAHAGGLELRVFPRHLFSGLSKALGFQDIRTGDAEFDEDYVVRSNDLGLARAWLSKNVRDAIRRAEGYELRLENGHLTMKRPKLEMKPEPLTALVATAAVVAKRGVRIREDWRRVAEARDGAVASDTLRIEVESGRVPLRIETESTEHGQTRTRVEGRIVGGKGTPYEAARAAELEGIEDELRSRVERLAPVSITSDGERVNLVLPGVETDEQRLSEACEVATALADRQSGTYR
jgi:hypothetical protein